MKKYLFLAVIFPCLTSYNNFVQANPITPEINIGDTRVVEGDAGQRQIQVMVSLSRPVDSMVTVDYATINGTATANADYIPGKGTITFAKGELVKWVTISIIGDTGCESDEQFDLDLSNPTNATIKKSKGTVTISNDDCLFPGAKKFAAYEVRFTHKGFTTFLSGPGDCPIRPNGINVLYGILGGVEDGGTDDVDYTGTMQLNLDMDICSVERLANGEDQVCGMRVYGSGSVDVTLKINYDGRGGYIQFRKNNHSFFSNVTGGCNDQIAEERTMVPDKTIGSSFNGLELAKLITKTLEVGTYVQDEGSGNVIIVEVLRKIK